MFTHCYCFSGRSWSLVQLPFYIWKFKCVLPGICFSLIHCLRKWHSKCSSLPLAFMLVNKAFLAYISPGSVNFTWYPWTSSIALPVHLREVRSHSCWDHHHYTRQVTSPFTWTWPHGELLLLSSIATWGSCCYFPPSLVSGLQPSFTLVTVNIYCL